MASFSIGVSILGSKQSYVQKSLTSILTCILLIEEMLISDRTVVTASIIKYVHVS